MSGLPFTKMHGAGNDFVVLDNTQGQIELSLGLIKRLADRHFGVGADQVLIVEKPDNPANDFKYRIFNSDGQEVQQCGNGARCFAQFVRVKGMTEKTRLRVETRAGIIQPEIIANDRVLVDMGPVTFDPVKLPFVCDGLPTRQVGSLTQYLLPLDSGDGSSGVWVSIASMGNPHVVLLMDKRPFDDYVQRVGQLLECHPRFPERVNVGFLTVLEKTKAHLRVFERGAGETLACGTGACAAACVGMSLGLLAESVEIVKAGGVLRIEWNGEAGSHVKMTGPTELVFEGVFIS